MDGRRERQREGMAGVMVGERDMELWMEGRYRSMEGARE